MGRKSSRAAILAATERVILRRGLAGTTIDAVAAEAGVSKGGLFYHFASKKELLLQLMEHYEKEFLAMRQKYFDDLPDGPTRLLKATILALVHSPVRVSGGMSNIVTLLDDVDMRARYTEAKMRLFGEISRDSPHPEKVALAMLASDGMWLMQVFGTIFPNGIHEKIVDHLLELIDFHMTTGRETAGASSPGEEQP